VGARIGAWTANLIPYFGPAISAMAFEAIHQNEAKEKEDTENLAKALAEGWVTQNENGDLKITAGSEKMVEELGLTASEIQTFGKTLGDGVEELKAYGE
jgi:hypothetical protein